MQWLQELYRSLEGWATLHPLVAGVMAGIISILLLSGFKPLLPAVAAPFIRNRKRDISGDWLVYYAAADSSAGYRTGRLTLRYRPWWGKSRARLSARDEPGFRRLLDDLGQGWYSLTHTWLRISLRNSRSEPGWEIMVRVSPGRNLRRLRRTAGLVLSFRTDRECDPTATRILLSRDELGLAEVAARLGGSHWLQAPPYQESDEPA